MRFLKTNRYVVLVAVALCVENYARTGGSWWWGATGGVLLALYDHLIPERP